MEAASNYEAIIAKNFENLLAQIKSSDWALESTTKFYQLSLKAGGAVKTVKVTGVFDVSPAKMKDVLFDVGSLVKYDDSKESREEIESGSNWKVFYTKGAKFFMVDPRDTLIVLAFKVEADGTILISGSTIEHSKVPQQKGRVRAFVEIMGYLLEPVAGDANKCKFTFVGMMDPKGSVPTMFVNKMVMKQGDVMEKLNGVAAKI